MIVAHLRHGDEHVEVCHGIDPYGEVGAGHRAPAAKLVRQEEAAKAESIGKELVGIAGTKDQGLNNVSEHLERAGGFFQLVNIFFY